MTGRRPSASPELTSNLSVIGTIGAWANGTFGYAVLGLVSPGFYYLPEMKMLRVWFSISGVFLTLYGVGCALFLWVLLRSTAYRAEGPVGEAASA